VITKQRGVLRLLLAESVKIIGRVPGDNRGAVVDITFRCSVILNSNFPLMFYFQA
jgi:hypothetical protein